MTWVEVYVTVAIFNKEEMQYKMRDIRLGTGNSILISILFAIVAMFQ